MFFIFYSSLALGDAESARLKALEEEGRKNRIVGDMIDVSDSDLQPLSDDDEKSKKGKRKKQKRKSLEYK